MELYTIKCPAPSQKKGTQIESAELLMPCVRFSQATFDGDPVPRAGHVIGHPSNRADQAS